MAKLTLNNISNINASPSAETTINANNDAIEAAFENTLSRNGSSPNTMGADLDMNSYRVVNLPAPTNPTEATNKAYVDNQVTSVANGVVPIQTAINAATVATTQASLATTAATTATTQAGVATTQAGIATTAATSAASIVENVWTKTEADARYTPIRNRIINGAMQISQERGTAFIDVTTGNVRVIDRWQGSITPTPGGTLRFQQIAALTPGGSLNRLRATVQVVDNTLAVDDFYGIRSLIEGRQISDAQFGLASAKPLVLRFGVKTSVAGTYGVQISNNAGDRSWVGTFVIAPGDVNTDLMFSFVIPGDTTGTWLTDTGVGLRLIITLATGTTRQGALGWQASGVTTIPAQVNFMATAGATFELFDVGLYVNVGVVPRWEVPEHASELVRCRRYYYTYSGGTSSGVGRLVNVAASTQTLGLGALHPQQMRAAPAMSIQWELNDVLQGTAIQSLVATPDSWDAGPVIPAGGFVDIVSVTGSADL